MGGGLVFSASLRVYLDQLWEKHISAHHVGADLCVVTYTSRFLSNEFCLMVLLYILAGFADYCVVPQMSTSGFKIRASGGHATGSSSHAIEGLNLTPQAGTSPVALQNEIRFESGSLKTPFDLYQLFVELMK